MLLIESLKINALLSKRINEEDEAHNRAKSLAYAVAKAGLFFLGLGVDFPLFSTQAPVRDTLSLLRLPYAMKTVLHYIPSDHIRQK